MFDIAFISYDEPNADKNWQHLKSIAPHAIRIHNIKGIPQAHIEAAKQVSTSYFFTVDGDNYVDENFDWEKVLDFQRNERRIHVWLCENAVNGLTYGYGGIKLWPTEHTQNIKEYSVDFTTSVAIHGFKVHTDIASKTCFNTGEFNTWRSSFRECVKLAGNLIKLPDPRTENRLHVWMNIGIDTKFGSSALQGAREGVYFALKNRNNEKILSKINDFGWLQEYYNVDRVFDANVLTKHGFKLLNFNKEESQWLKKIMNKT